MGVGVPPAAAGQADIWFIAGCDGVWVPLVVLGAGRVAASKVGGLWGASTLSLYYLPAGVVILTFT